MNGSLNGLQNQSEGVGLPLPGIETRWVLHLDAILTELLTSSYFFRCGFTHLMIQDSATVLYILTRMWDLAHSCRELKNVLGWKILHSPSVVSVRVNWGDCGCKVSHCCSS